MKIALNIFLVLTLTLSNSLIAQQKQCDATIAEINRLVAESDLDQAYAKFSALDKKCIATEDLFYHNMQRVLISKTIGAANEEEKQNILNQLLDLYTTHDYILPKNKSSNKVRKAMALQVNRPDDQDKIYKLLDEAFAKDRVNFVDPEGLVLYYNLFFKKLTAEKKDVDYSALINKRDEVLAQLEVVKNLASVDRPYNLAIRSVRKLTESVLNCDRIATHYNSIFETRKSDVIWLSTTATSLLDAKCTTDSIFKKVAMAWYDVKVDSRSAGNLAVAELRSGNHDRAIALYEEAANLASKPEEKATYYYTLARQLMAIDKLKVIEFTKKAVLADPTMGKAYLIMADAYAGIKDCGSSEFEKKLVYYLAAEASAKAGIADPTYVKIAAKKSEQYLKLAPSANEIKTSKMGGKSVLVGCGLNQKVSVPKS
ncbi:hypothetical protein [Flavobacterium ardleyense]|uniref:hypothetical protein n=1 Tax=Flavobacterium ardleyense TaxID=2038737 RepID=UPI00298D1F99|nr:hypothetical protein [Flavobacterium ardleyense]